MNTNHTTLAVQRFLDDLPEGSSAEPLVRALLDRAVSRLHQLCASLLYRKYPRLTCPPLNLVADELPGAVVERLLKAMRQVHPGAARQFFALACQHIRWELNEMARRFDEQPPVAELQEDLAAASLSGPSSSAAPSADVRRILTAIQDFPEDEREAFDLVRIQGLPQAEAAHVLGTSVSTINRRLHRGLRRLTTALADLYPASAEDTDLAAP